jgi:acetylornithine/succinyldiaminopimelate/putrescine aminotransferase
VVAAIAAQAAQLLFYSTAGELAIRHRAADALLAFAAGVGLEQVFFCNSGAEANENALKVASKLTGRTRLLSIEGGWHGRTLACLAVTDDLKITAPYAAWLAPADRLLLNDLQALQALDFGAYAAVILEPIQSMAGIRVVDPQWLKLLATKAQAAGCLLILDEIQTGVGRLGTPYAAHFFDVRPDMITSAKGLASGLPIGALLMSGAVAAGLKSADLGSTFGGGPLACAALIATLQIIQSDQLMSWAAQVGAQLKTSLPGIAGIGEVRGAGLLLGLHTTDAAALKTHLFERGALLGGCSDPHVLRLMPPLNISEAAINCLIEACRDFGAVAQSAA